MKNKFLILPLLLVAMVGLVHAGSFVEPTSSSTISGNVVFNITTFDDFDANATITGTSALSGDSKTFYALNGTGAWGNVTVDTTSWRDAGDWTFSATIYDTNNTANGSVTATTSIIVDNGQPTISGCTIDGASASNTTVSSSTVTFVCTLYNATSANVYWKDSSAVSANGQTDSDTSCESTTYTNSYSTSGVDATCTLSGAGDEEMTLYFDANDGADTVQSTHYEVTSEGGSSTGGDTTDGGVDTTQILDILQNKKTVFVILASVAGLFVLFAMWYMVRKK